MKKSINKFKSGFTLVELTLAMIFISVLMITIAVLVINITQIYTKGVTVKDVNATGRILVDDFTRTIGSSPAAFFANNDPSTYFDPVNGQPYYLRQEGGGRFCTGSSSYIWNYAENGEMLDVNRYQSDHSKELRLIKVMDTDRDYCRVSGSGSNQPLKPYFDDTTDNSYIDLLASQESDMALYELQAFTPVIDRTTGHVYYALSFVLGTLRGVEGKEPGVIKTNNTCIPPADKDDQGSSQGFDFDYCAINKFDVSMRATGNTGSNN